MKGKLFLITAALIMSGISAYAETGSASYGYIYPSHDGIRKVMNTSDANITSKYGYIDEEGNVVSERKYDSATDFTNGIGVMQSGNAIMAINTKGDIIKTFDSSLSSILYYDGEKGIARKDGLSYLIDKEGKILNGTGYNTLYYDPLTWKTGILASKGDLYGFIDWDGNILTPIEYTNIYGSQDSSGIMAAVKKDGKHGFLAGNGKVFVPAIYESAGDFRDGVGILWKNGKAGFINTSGMMITNFKYDNAQNFSEGLGSFMIGTKWGYLDKSGKEVTPATYDSPAFFKNGYANIQKADESWIKVESPIKKDRKINVYLNDKWIYLDQEPVLENGSSLAPIRGIAEALGYLVTWNASTNTATLQNNKMIIHLTVGSDKTLVNTFDDGALAKTVMLNTPAALINGRILVPVRFIAENIGAEVVWNQNNQTIMIKTGESRP